MTVDSIVKGAPAERAGLLQGDIVESIDDKRIQDNAEGLDSLRQIPIGENARIKIRRGGKSMELTIKAE